MHIAPEIVTLGLDATESRKHRGRAVTDLRTAWSKLLLTAFGVIAGLATIVTANPETLLAKIVCYAGIATLAGCLLLWVLLQSPPSRAIQKRLVNRIGRLYQWKPVGSRLDMESIDRFSNRLIGGALLGLDGKWAIQRESGLRCFFMLVQTSRDTQKTVGYFSVYPLTAVAAADVEAGRLNATAFEPRHIAGDHEFHALYVGGVAGSGPAAKYRVVQLTLRRVRELSARRTVDANRPALLTVYTRPTTEVGLTRALERGFQYLESKTFAGKRVLGHVMCLRLQWNVAPTD